MLAKFGGKKKNLVGEGGGRNVVVPFALVTDMDKTMIYPHPELVRRLVAIGLVPIEIFETL